MTKSIVFNICGMIRHFRKRIRMYFGVTHAEANGGMVMAFMMVLVLVIPPLFQSNVGTTSENQSSPPEKFDLNAADTTQLKKIPGIGPVFARRIVRYRDKLGGFVRMDQLQEVYHLHDSTIENLMGMSYLNPGFQPQKINLNQDSFKKMVGHPYFSYQLTKVIFNYRKQHGDFDSEEDLKKIHLVSDSVLFRIQPYVTF